MYQVYSFLFSLFRRYYYKDNIEACYYHSMIIMSCLMFFPIIGLLITFGVDYDFELFQGFSDAILTWKIIFMPFIAVLFIITILILRRLRKHKKDELEKHEFSQYSLKYKILMGSIIFIVFWSILWIPILSFEIMKLL